MLRQFSRFVAPAGLLAHYTSAATALDHILPTGKLRLSPYKAMNDPVENKDLGLVGFGFHDGPGSAAAPDLMSRLQSRIEHIRNQVRLASFCRDITTYEGADIVHASSIVRPRMWEQYGEHHEGICLAFSRERLEAQITRFLGTGRHYWGNVSYTPSGWAGSEARHSSGVGLDGPALLDDAVLAHVERYRDDFFFLKADDWAGENEARLLVLEPRDEYFYFDYGDALTAIVLGERYSDSSGKAEHAAQRAGVQLLQLGWSDGRPYVSGLEER